MRWPSPSIFPAPGSFPEPSERDVYVVVVKEPPVKVVEAPESLSARNVRNAGAHPVTLSRDSALKAGQAYDLAAAKEVVVWLAPGESLWARCQAGQESTLEVL